MHKFKYNVIKGDIKPFIQRLKSSLLTRSPMSLAPANEEVLQATVELLLPERYRIPQLCLVMDGRKKKGDDRYGFADIFVVGEAGQGITLELKYISVVG
ncbi:13871_t:CDS:1, partial [Gigaspora rosea]